MRTAMNRALRGDHKFLMAVIAFIRLSGLSDIGGDAIAVDADTSADEAIFLRRQGFVLEPRTSGSAKSWGTTTKPNSRPQSRDVGFPA
jgi:hypothetical protein